MKRLMLCILFLFAPAISPAAEALHRGDKAPPFSLPDLYGRRISLDYFDGHPGVVVFWSTSSPGSTVLLNDFHGYQQTWGRESLAIVAVNADGAPPATSASKAIRDYADSLDIIFPVLLDGGQETLAAYGISKLPTAVVIDARGRVAAIVRGSEPIPREELKQQIILAMGATAPDATAVAVANRSDPQGANGASGQPAASACSIPRARSCTRLNENDPSASDPAIMAVRVCICHGDVDAAQIMLTAVNKEGQLRPDLRFALAHMMLLKGRSADAQRAFEALRERYPRLGWGEWGLGIVALSAGNVEQALGHFLAASAGGWSIPEAETAVMRYLEGYWRTNNAAPGEEHFLAIFEELNSVRLCYRQLNQRG